jgi:beta-catenin-like protein 1
MRGEDLDEDMEDEFYIRRLDAGLFTLQLVDYIMLEISATGASSVRILLTLYKLYSRQYI